MTTETLSYTIAAGGMVRAPRGKFFYIKTCPNGGLSITASGRPGAPIKFSGMGAGLKYGPVDDSGVWEYLEITSATAQTIEIIIGDDDVEIAGAVSVTGTVTTIDATVSVVGVADVSLAAASTTFLTQNASSKGWIIGNLSTNASAVRISHSVASATNGIELQPGEKISLPGNGTALYAYNPGAIQSLQILVFI